MKKITDEIIDEQTKEMIGKEKTKRKFVLDNCDSIMERIYNIFKKTFLINAEEISYSPEKYPFTEYEFSSILEVIFSYAIEKNKIFYDFPNIIGELYICCLKYKDLNILLRIANGQGTLWQMRIDLENDWKENISFTYENFKQWMIENYKE